MIELVRHIEILLLENDCVVVPGFGGFITHYMPASWNAEEKTFSPPLRSIGFNPQLKMNDGILVQSYMETYNTNFSDATKILEQGVNRFVEILHKDGKVDMANIGEITLSVHGTYVFSSYDDKITSPFLYGLDAFEIKDLKTLQLPTEKIWVPQAPAVVATTNSKKIYEIRINRAVVRNAVAAVAAIVLFFYMSTPIENTYVERENYAQLLPADLFGKIERQSLLTTPVGGNLIAENVTTLPETVIESEVDAESEAVEQQKVPVAVKEVKVPKETTKAETTAYQQPAQSASKLYHIIIASVAFKDDAQALVNELKAKGYQNAKVHTNEERIRVSIASYSTREEADRQLVEIRRNDQYKAAWLLIR